MDLWQLQIFVHVVDQGSFSRAAEAVHLSQPTVSAHIKDLEERLGCRLIDRLGRRAEPTAAGKTLYQYARRILDLRDEAKGAISACLDKPMGRLAVGGSTIPGTYILPKIIGGFARRYPDVFVSLDCADTRAMVHATSEGRVDLAVVGAVPTDRSLEHEIIARDELVLVAPPDHRFAGRDRVTVRELTAEPFVLREPGSGTRRSLEEHLASVDLGVGDLSCVAQLGSTEAVKEAVKAGAGLSVVSRLAVDQEVASRTLAILGIEGLDMPRSFYLVRHRQRSPSLLCRTFVDFLRQAPGIFKADASV